MISPHAMGVVLPVLFEAMTDIKKKWQTRRGGLVLLGGLTHRAPIAISEYIPAIIPVISECMRDVRKEVVTTAEEVRCVEGCGQRPCIAYPPRSCSRLPGHVCRRLRRWQPRH